MALQHLRSSTANKRPTPAAMSDGQLALNTNLVSPGLFFKDSNGDSVKIGPVHVGTTAPNVTPGAGGQAGNSKGEQWLDTSSSRYVFKIWDGTDWRTEDGEFVNASGDTMTGALIMDNQQQVRFRETTGNGTNFIAIQAPASVTADRTLTLPDVTGTIVSTADTGTVTSTMILDGTIVNADINASAAIVDTKLATIATAGKVSNSATTATNANTASAIVARDASGNFSAGTITAALTGNASTVTTNANLTGDVTSVGNATSIAAGVIVNADVNASAAIAGTKISPDFGSQTIATTGVFSHALGAAATPSLTFTGDLNTGIFSPSADTLAFSEGGVERARIDSAGRVLVGTAATSRSVLLATNDSVVSNAGIEIFRAAATSNPLNAGLVITVNPANNNGQSGLVLAKTNGNANGSFTAVQPGTLGSVVFAGADGSSLRPAAQITGVGGTPNSGISPGSLPGQLAFSTTADGGTTPTERMRIDSTGKVAIGASPGSAIQFTVDGNIPDDGQAFAVGIICSAIANATTTAIYGFISDIEPTVGTVNTVTHLYRYYARQNISFGSATVTNQYGFAADSSLTGATNNYGFFSSINAATGRWNFYAAGTANNYFAGKVGIGTTSPATTLDVDGDVTITDKIMHAGDANTAIRFPGNDVFSVETNGLERLRVHSDGNVSIGSTTNTGDKLYVNGTIRTNGQIATLAGDTDTAPGYTWAGDEDTGMFRTGANSLGFSAGGSEVARFNFGGTSGRRQLYFESTGEVWSGAALFLEGVSDVRSVTIATTTTASASNVFVNSVSGILMRSTSSVKYKTEVEDAELSYSEALVYGSRPVWYRSLSESDPSDYSYWGFIAEEVAEIDPRMVHWGDDGPESVQYDRYVVHLVSVIQKQKQRLDALEARLTAAGI